MAGKASKPIEVPDPERLARTWCDCPSDALNPALVETQFESRERPCARCGKRFETTPARRMLCKPCYKAGEVGLDL